ncbi:MAG TPA: glycosyltransferase family 9 protein [Verrucomicrobiae bacterium]|nr:glycosyltransferase family 9 protein [Verrucomicrobiae bacterium]
MPRNSHSSAPTLQHSITRSPRSILIIKPSSVGDVVQALPTVNLIRRKYPDAHIAWLINDALASLLKNCPIIDERIEFRRREYFKFPVLLARLRRERFDVVVDLQGLLRSGLMTWATRAPRRIGLSDAREGARLFYTETVAVNREHAVDRYLRAARHLGCDAGPIEFPLGLPPRAGADGLIAVNPSARWKTKLWGDDKFTELVRRLPSKRVVLTGSVADRPRCELIARGCRNLAGGTTLLDLAELYARCAVVVTNDSGPMHIAAAVGTPVVAIFGPTDAALTGPYGKQHVVLRAGIPCSPCLKGHCTHTPRMECMTLVTVEQVLAAMKPFLL